MMHRQQLHKKLQGTRTLRKLLALKASYGIHGVVVIAVRKAQSDDTLEAVINDSVIRLARDDVEIYATKTSEMIE